MNAIVTLRFPDPDAPLTERDEIKTYSQLRHLYVDPKTGFLVIITKGGDFSFDPTIWKSFVVSRDIEDTLPDR